MAREADPVTPFNTARARRDSKQSQPTQEIFSLTKEDLNDATAKALFASSRYCPSDYYSGGGVPSEEDCCAATTTAATAASTRSAKLHVECGTQYGRKRSIGNSELDLSERHGF